LSLHRLHRNHGYATPRSESDNTLHFSATPLRAKYLPYTATLFLESFEDWMDTIELFVRHVSITVVALPHLRPHDANRDRRHMPQYPAPYRESPGHPSWWP